MMSFVTGFYIVREIESILFLEPIRNNVGVDDEVYACSLARMGYHVMFLVVCPG